MPQGSVIRIPTKSEAIWSEVRRAISYRLSETLGKSMDEIAPGLIVEELVRVAAHHIYVEGYPTQDQVKIRQDRQRNQLHEIKALAARIDALEGREGAADDS